MAVTSQSWLDTIRNEYLSDFIKNGGAAVKFVVPVEGVDQQTIIEQLERDAVADNYEFAHVDAASTKMHMIDKVFHTIAGQIDWDALSYGFVRQFFVENGYSLPERRDDFDLQDIARLNNREERFLRKEIQSWLEERIFHDFEMSQEFRIAMIRLCLEKLDRGAQSNYLGDAVKEWLRGELRLISVLKDALIVEKIARHNARHMLFSLARWLRLNSKSGLVVALDISRCLVSTKARDPEMGFYYSIPAVLDVYELLRQFIDGTDEMEGCLIVVVAPRDFLVDEKRGVARYDALKLRIWDEVRDRQRQNPLASLTRLADSPIAQ